MLDAEYSEALNRIIILTYQNEVRLFDPVTFDAPAIPLPTNATSLSLSPDGLSAAVAYIGFVSILDLRAQTISVTIETNTSSGDIVLGAAGYAYLLPDPGRHALVDMHSIEIATGVVHGDDANGSDDAGSKLKLHPGGKVIYGITQYLTPESLESFDISQGVSGAHGRSLDDTHPDPCGDLWLSRDGSSIFTGCGNAFNALPGMPGDMFYRGSFETVPNSMPTGAPYQSLALDEEKGHIYALPGPQYLNTPESTARGSALDTFDYQTLKLVTTQQIPCLAEDGGKARSNGQLVFAPSGGSHVYALIITDSLSSGLATFDRE
ncbi:MAG: hypothetical protein WDO69_12045 [Pseudomonadota bacterium]